ncbi:retrovirus-related pol polyprotein from transposon TNT 1-94, partial [Tanacetum coccineum]
MKYTKPETQDSLNKSVSGTVTVSDTEPTTPLVPIEVKNTKQKSKINELTKLVQMLIDEKGSHPDTCTVGSQGNMMGQKVICTKYVDQASLKMVENQNDVKVKQIRTDNGTEFKNYELESFCDEKGISQNFSSPYTPEYFCVVARMEAIRIFLDFATYMNFKVYQMDIKSAFLNGKLKEEVYVKQPLSFESSEFPDYVCKLDKALYGLKQTPKACSSVKTPMVPPNNLSPDLVVLCTSYQSNPKESHLTATKRILRYLKGTPTLGLYYPKCSSFDLKGYSDSDYAGCNMDRKSTLVAMSLAKAKYVTAARCYASILWMKSQLSNYDIHYKMVPIFCDNTSAIAISNNPVLHSRTKHIDIIYHFIRDHILKGDIELYFIPTEYQLADIFTKPLDEPTFTRLKAELGMEFWCKEIAYDPNPSTDKNKPRLLKEFLIKFTVMNGKKPLKLDFNTFTTSTGLDYKNGVYVAHPSPEVVKAEQAKIVLGRNYSSTEQVNSIQQLITYSLITGTKDEKFGYLPGILSNSNFSKDPSTVTKIELTAHMIAVNNKKDSVSPLPLFAKKKKGKSQTVTPTLPNSQCPEASRALSKKRKQPKPKKT